MGQAKCRATKIRPKADGSGIFGRFPTFDKCQSEELGDVISGVDVDNVNMDARATFGESALNIGRTILFFGRSDPFYASLCPVFNWILQPTGSNWRCHIQQVYEANCPRLTCDFGDHRMNLSREIPPEAV